MFFALDVFQGHIILLKLLVLTVTEIAHGKLGVILVWKGLGLEDGVTAVCYWRLSFTCLHLCRSLMWVPVLPQHQFISFTLNLNSLCKNSAKQIES